eukprot:5521546-Pyramimonas_sp.AAC.1
MLVCARVCSCVFLCGVSLPWWYNSGPRRTLTGEEDTASPSSPRRCLRPTQRQGSQGRCKPVDRVATGAIYCWEHETR